MGMKSMLRRMLNFFRMAKRSLFAPVKPMGIEDAFSGEAEGDTSEGDENASDEGVLVWVPPEAKGETAGKPPARYSSEVLAQPAVGDDEHGSRKTEAIIGLDFGTSCCKVIVRFPWLAGSPAYPVQFDVDEGCPLFLATEIHYESASGELRLQPFSGSEKQEGLKLAVWKRPEEENSKEFVVGYLALVMKHAKDWVRKENQEDLGQFDDFDWSVNVGIPSNGFDGPEWEVFRDVATAAWELACTRRKITVKSARRALSGGFSGAAYGRVDLRPEVIAEVQGYCRSYMRRDGLHLMVDAVAMQVGAATAPAVRHTLRQHRDYGVKLLAWQRPVRVRSRHQVVQVVLRPLVGDGGGDDLLRQHVEGPRRDRQCVQPATLDRPQ